MVEKSIIRALRDRVAQNPKRIVFPESADPRVVEAAREFQSAGLGTAILVHSDGLAAGDLEVVSPADPRLGPAAAKQLFQNRQHKGLSAEAAEQAIDDPLLFAALLVKTGYVDGSVAGSVATTASVIRAGLYGVGPKSKLVSSFFLMQLADQAVTYADCGVVPDPDPSQLAEIAITSAESHRTLTGEIPRVAMLSFSTKGSAEHPRVDKVREALEITKGLAPDLLIDGELQFDAAFVPAVAQRKVPDSPVAGQANVFIFPDLDSGNIAYKITERLGGATALGPLVQGLQYPCMDLSRGCQVQDIVDVAVIASIMADRV